MTHHLYCRYQGSAAAELDHVVGSAPISRTRARARGGARAFILLWSAIIFLPEDVQLHLIDIISGFLTVVVVLAVAAVNKIRSHWQASVSGGAALVALAIVLFCAVGHKERSQAEPDDDDHEGEKKDEARDAAAASRSRDDAGSVDELDTAVQAANAPPSHAPEVWF